MEHPDSLNRLDFEACLMIHGKFCGLVQSHCVVCNPVD